jgi:hypothetical protein
MENQYYGQEDTGLQMQNGKFPGIQSPQDLYKALSGIWCAYTCAPRMRQDWTEENMTLGQCSVTAFLAQDVFGGDVYGIPLKEGGFHCFNLVNGHLFDLTSAQFREKLDYSNSVIQRREDHFAKTEKKERYEYLKQELIKYCAE